MNQAVSYSGLQLPNAKNLMGYPRHIGVEMEFCGLEISKTAELLADSLGGRVFRLSQFHYHVKNPDLGTFEVIADFQFLRRVSRSTTDLPRPLHEILNLRHNGLTLLSDHIVPCVVRTPLFHFYHLNKIDELFNQMRANGARGSKSSALFGFHTTFYIEPFDYKPASLLNYLRAYMCLAPCLQESSSVTQPKKLAPHIQQYSPGYQRLVLKEDYHPSFKQFASDYLSFSSCINRGLDFLSLLCYLDESQVRLQLGDAEITPKPALMYRLTETDIENPEWSILNVWQNWLQIEHIAADERQLKALVELFRETRRKEKISCDAWKIACKKWLKVGVEFNQLAYR